MKRLNKYSISGILETLKNLALEDSLDRVRQLENQTLSSILAPIQLASSVIGSIFICVSGMNMKVYLVFFAVLVIGSLFFYLLPILKVDHRVKRHAIGMVISLQFIIIYHLLYDKIGILIWMLLTLVALPTVLSSDDMTLIHILIAGTYVGTHSMLFREDHIININVLYRLSTSVVLLFTFIVFMAIRFIYNYIVRFKRQQYSSLLSQKEEITGLYEEIYASEEDLLSKNEELNFLAFTDELTGLANRKKIKERVDYLVNTYDLITDEFYFAYIDIDNFKIINDSLGHAIGDKLLVQIKDRFLKVVEPVDILGRIGGDDFVLIINQKLTKEELNEYLFNLLGCTDETFKIDNYEMSCTLSIGVTIWPLDAQDTDAILRSADTAMYRAKLEGRNSVHYYRKEMKDIALDRFKMENLLTNALPAGELYLDYQPIIDLMNNRVDGYEALMRWRSPQMGQVSPAVFIPVMEDLGLIHEVGLWLLKKTCETLRVANDNYDKNIAISINISTIQLSRSGFVEQFGFILEETMINPYNIILEITESLFMRDAEHSIKVLNELKDLGVRISVDDFGTGYSSLSYLVNLPIDIIKIDKSFIDKIGSHEANHSIIAGITSLASGMNLRVVAEGVETKEQVDYLNKISCGYVQGYYYSKPLSELDAVEYYKYFGNKDS